MFGAMFHDVRESAKAVKRKWEDEAAQRLERAVIDDLRKNGIGVHSFKITLGQYRGSRYVASARLIVEIPGETEAKILLGKLITVYSPKFKLKELSADGRIAQYDVR
jgi:hypothetical protein